MRLRLMLANDTSRHSQRGGDVDVADAAQTCTCHSRDHAATQKCEELHSITELRCPRNPRYLVAGLLEVGDKVAAVLVLLQASERCVSMSTYPSWYCMSAPTLCVGAYVSING